MFGRLMFFVVGAAAGIFAKDQLRSVAKGMITAGVKAGIAVKEIAAEAMEDMQDEAAKTAQATKAQARRPQ